MVGMGKENTSIITIGLTFSKDIYDIERYEELRYD